MLIEQIKQDLVSHIKSGDKIKISITRLLIAALKDKEISLRNNQDFDELINDNIVMEIINKMIKQRKIAAQTYKEANRADLAEKELEEAQLLSHYLPSQLSEDQLNAKVEEIIKGVDAKSLRDMSKVMKIIKENLSGKCDMQMASNLVKSKLSE